MALTTRCPHCHTAFRVANDQLKLRAGLVRCGACQEVFNGLEHLLSHEAPLSETVPLSADAGPSPADGAPSPADGAPSPADAAPSPAVPAEVGPAPSALILVGPPASESAAAGSPAAGSPAADSFEAELETNPEPKAEPLLPAAPVTANNEYFEDDAWSESRPSAAEQYAEFREPAPATTLPVSKKPESASGKFAAMRRTAATVTDGADSGAEEPGFVKRARQAQHVGGRMRRFMQFGIAFFAVTLLFQAGFSFRNQLAASYPQTKPVLQAFCRIAGCRLELPMQIDAVSIEASELQQLPAMKDTLLLTTLLRNRSAVAQAWPNIELSLNDANEKPVARRVFVPADYLPAPKDAAAGMAPTSEQPVKLMLELAQITASGYRVYLFYP